MWTPSSTRPPTIWEKTLSFCARSLKAPVSKIINTTGWWLDVPRFLRGASPNQLAREFIRDVEEGFRGTDIKAGILKCAADFRRRYARAGTYDSCGVTSAPRDGSTNHGAFLSDRPSGPVVRLRYSKRKAWI